MHFRLKNARPPLPQLHVYSKSRHPSLAASNSSLNLPQARWSFATSAVQSFASSIEIHFGVPPLMPVLIRRLCSLI